jgi:transcriptional regulator with XRE-family HTH domain
MGERLEIFISACGYKKGDFAAVLGIQQPQLSRYLGASAQTPQKEILTKLFNLGCNLNWLLTGEGEMYTDQRQKEHTVTDTEIAALESLLSKLKSQSL